LGDRAADRTESGHRLTAAQKHFEAAARASAPVKGSSAKMRSGATDLRGSDRGNPTTKAPHAVSNPRMDKLLNRRYHVGVLTSASLQTLTLAASRDGLIKHAKITCKRS
jgi:hypothetical protein